MLPTVTGFQSFIYNVMGIDPLVLPSDSPVIGWAFQVAMMIVSPDLAIVATANGTTPATSLYELAVYNLAGDNLVNYAQDQAGRTYFADLRASLKINAFAAGVVTSASDAGTSDSLAVPESLKNLTLSDLQNLKTPWGRAYLAIAQRYGTLWGLT
jgi:hypothetical protein